MEKQAGKHNVDSAETPVHVFALSSTLTLTHAQRTTNGSHAPLGEAEDPVRPPLGVWLYARGQHTLAREISTRLHVKSAHTGT